jgi:hypothetical protein
MRRNMYQQGVTYLFWAHNNDIARAKSFVRYMLAYLASSIATKYCKESNKTMEDNQL